MSAEGSMILLNAQWYHSLYMKDSQLKQKTKNEFWSDIAKKGNNYISSSKDKEWMCFHIILWCTYLLMEFISLVTFQKEFLNKTQSIVFWMKCDIRGWHVLKWFAFVNSEILSVTVLVCVKKIKNSSWTIKFFH